MNSMKVRQFAVTVVLAWLAGECWAAPWDPISWPNIGRGISLAVFVSLCLLSIFERTRTLGTDAALLTFAATLGASFMWSLWMWHEWFNWSWIHWLPTITGSDGEVSYRMIEYEFFLLLFGAGALLYGIARKAVQR